MSVDRAQGAVISRAFFSDDRKAAHDTASQSSNAGESLR